MKNSFRFAHISDIHLPTFKADGIGKKKSPGEGHDTGISAFLNKRFFSGLSWFAKRRHIHGKEITDLLVADILARAPDHILVTGDLTNLSLQGEFIRASQWLQSLGTPTKVSAIPGNHDLLLDNPITRSGLGLCAPFMQGDDDKEGQGFPFVKRRHDILFIGLSTAIETPIGWCSGRLGTKQLSRLGDILADAGRQNLCRIVALHHPPAGPQKPRGSLEDHEMFARLIAKSGAELVLHGHTHRSSMHALAGPAGPVPVLGVASFSVRPDKGYPVGCWHEYDVCRRQNGWRISLNVHRYDGLGATPTLAARALLRSV